MNPLPERHVAVLRELRTLWPESRLVVIGATAVACHIGLSWRGTVGPYLLGGQIGGLVDRAERRLVRRFVTALLDPGDRRSSLARMSDVSPPGWKDRERLRRRWTAFMRGFER